MRIDRLRIGILAAMIVVIPFSIAPATTAPCDCFYYPSHQRAFREAKAVFIGEVTKVDRKAELPEDVSYVYQAITFKVIKSWKGPKGQVRTWEDGMHLTCVEWKFEEGQKYLVYAEPRDGVLVVNGYCSRTRQLETKDADALKEFDELNNPEFLRYTQESRYRKFYGTWQVVSYRFGDGVSVGPDDARKLLGLKIRLGAKRAESGRDVCEQPSYELKRMDADQFLREFKTSLTSIGIKRRTVELLNVQCDAEDWRVPGGTMLIVEKGRMLTMWDGVFFSVKKVAN
jgi:hypothetical protein